MGLGEIPAPIGGAVWSYELPIKGEIMATVTMLYCYGDLHESKMDAIITESQCSAMLVIFPTVQIITS